MADVYDVMNALAGLAAQAVYPNGTSQPSVAGIDIVCYAGWPTASRLDQDLAAGKAHITVFARPEERNTSRYMTQTATAVAAPPTLSLSATGQAVAVSGSVPTPFQPQNVAIVVNGKPYTYAVQSADTLASIATGLAASIAVDCPGTSSAGAVVNVAAGAKVGALRVGTSGSSSREIRRQERKFQVTIWADTPDHRKAIANAVDAALSEQQFISLPDGTGGRLIYVGGGGPTDTLQKAKLYRHDLLYTVEYATTVIDAQYQIVAIEQTFSANGGPVQTTYQ